MKETILVVCALAVGFGLGALKYCKPAAAGRAITMTIIRDLPNKAPATIINKGDVLTWTKPDQSPLKVKFDFASPCSEGVGILINTCHVNVPNGMFIYSCDQDVCPDPEVPVGSEYLYRGTGSLPTVNAKGFNPLVAVYCNASVTPNVAAAAPQTATAGQVFNWLGVGSPAPDWTVTGVGAGVCQEGTSFSRGNSKCTVQPGKTGTYTYQVHVNGCATPDSSATLTIQ
jgi:hypothetical protein